MADQNIQQQKAKTTKQLTEELNNVVHKNEVLEDKMKEMEKLLKIVMERLNKNTDKINENDTIFEENKCAECNQSFVSKGLLKKHKEKHNKRIVSAKSIRCNHCGEIFKENWLLEVHMKSHADAETFECELCSKTFQSKWRLGKHRDIHSNPETKKCHYFNNEKTCPFEEIGCKFLHKDSEMCQSENRCKHKLCPLKHKQSQALSENELGEKEILNGYENDMKSYRIIQMEFEIDNTNKKCTDCKFSTNSYGVIKIHENMMHNRNHNFAKIMEGFEIDDEEYVDVLSENIGQEAFERFPCEKCNFKSHSEGTLKVHEYDSHTISPH